MRQNYINHVALVLDRSISMRSHAAALVRVADDLVRHLAEQSTALDQETRVTVYSFGDDVTCLIYDKDVLRLPSIASLYRISGNTALIDATYLSQTDLAMTPEKYGEHAFLTYVLTDGMENRSRHSAHELSTLLSKQPDNWTVAALVPDVRGESYARQVGYYAGNIAIWDARTEEGLTAAMTTVRAATDDFMRSRVTGVRGTHTLFAGGAAAVNTQTIKQAGALPLSASAYVVLPVLATEEIRPFIWRNGFTYVPGCAFYQLTKTETIQAGKAVMIRRKDNGQVYTGAAARQLLGLPNAEARVRPDHNPGFDIFIQSTSVNRKLVPGTKVLFRRRGAGGE